MHLHLDGLNSMKFFVKCRVDQISEKCMLLHNSWPQMCLNEFALDQYFLFVLYDQCEFLMSSGCPAGCHGNPTKIYNYESLHTQGLPSVHCSSFFPSKYISNMDHSIHILFHDCVLYVRMHVSKYVYVLLFNVLYGCKLILFIFFPHIVFH